MPEPQGEIFDAADRFRRQLLANERAAASEMIRVYGQSWTRIKAQIDDLTAQIAAGGETTAAKIARRERLKLLRAQVEGEIRRFAEYAEGSIIREQQAAVDAALDNARQLTMTGLPPEAQLTVRFYDLPREAVQDLVGFLSDGSPLRDLLGELPEETGKAVAKALQTGITLGQNPRAIARAARGQMGIGLSRALRISRTEVLRSYREATKRAYQANDGVIKGWIWHAHIGPRTCGACWAMHGTFHSLDERLDDHPNGRCAMVPVTKTWAELGIEGIPETRVQVEPGMELFSRLSDAEQAAIVGRAKQQAIKDGEITLRDLVGRTRSRKWGTHRYERSLTAAREAANG